MAINTKWAGEPSWPNLGCLRRAILVPKFPLESTEAVISSVTLVKVPLCSFLHSSLSHRNCYPGLHHPRHGSHPLHLLNTSFIRGPPLCFHYKLLPVRHLHVLNCLSHTLGAPNPTLPSSSCTLSLLCLTAKFLQRAIYPKSAALPVIHSFVNSIELLPHMPSSTTKVLTEVPMLTLSLHRVHTLRP